MDFIVSVLLAVCSTVYHNFDTETISTIEGKNDLISSYV